MNFLILCWLEFLKQGIFLCQIFGMLVRAIILVIHGVV
jgi:hypothetical protein